MAEADEKALLRLIEPELKALGFDLVRLQFVAGSDEPTLQLMAERPETGQLTIDDCAALSRRVSAAFDEAEAAGNDPIDHAYRLEVSSPGIDRPLTRGMDYANWTGHEARVNLIDAVDGRKQLRGEIVGIDGDMVTIADRKSGELTFALANVHSAKLVLTDALIAATAPLDSAGADEFEEDTAETEGQD